MNLKSFQNSLLDLSKTNNLINYKDRLHTSVSVMYPSIDIILNKLFNDETLDVFNIDTYVSKFSGEKDLSKSNIDFDSIYPQIENKITKNNILLYKFNGSVINVLKNIIKKNNETQTEKGLNVLYISFGMINYIENGDDLMAPLLLVPIKISNVGRTYKISLYEEEISLNPNFKYKLAQEHKIKLNDFNIDDDLNSYIDNCNKLLSNVDYYIEKTSYISLFSFNKINMYLDIIDNEAQIKKNEIVKGLLNGTSVPNATQANLDKDPLTIVDVDNTQYEAIEAVRSGESIVLEGPPGTGKSQTITNIISSAVYDGKKVLFVSEKLAALNVVYDKLKKNNLEEFTLALHSNKTNKKVVIADLYNTLFKEKTTTSKKAIESLVNTKGIENILDDYSDSLHKKNDKFELSPFEIFSFHANNNIDTGLDIPDDKLNISCFNMIVNILNEYKSYEDIIEYDYRKSPFYLIRKSKFSKDDIKKLTLSKEELTPILKNIVEIKKLYDINLYTFDDYRVFYQTYNSLINAKYYYKDFFNKKKIDSYIELLYEIKEDVKAISKAKNVFEKTFEDTVFELDLENTYENLLRYKNKLFKSLRPGYRKAVKDLKKHTINNKKYGYLRLLASVVAAKDYKLFLGNYNDRIEPIKKILNKNYDGINTDYANLFNMLKGIKNGYTLDNFSYLKLDKFFKLDEYDMTNLKYVYDNEIYTIDIYTYDIKELFKLISRSINSYDLIDAYKTFESNILNKLISQDAISYLDYALDNNFKLEELNKPFEATYYSLATDYLINNIPALKEFNKLLMDKMVEEYKDLDNKRFDIYKSILREEIQKLKPNPDAIASGSLASTIKRENLKKRRQMSVREILNIDNQFIKTLKPIFLMSPLSVSSYLAPSFKFDLVIFDEASQVYPFDAIGAIYRSSQVVICGDSKQMPPTNFFKSNIMDDEEDSASDFESILDMAKTALKVYRLKWHYRSKCEELIAFSNKYIYQQELITFTSAKAHEADFGLELYKINGVYDKNTRTNEAEAKKVVELIDEHYKKYGNTRSIGVVAFSISQEHLIEKMVSEYMQKNEISDNLAEPLFVKNLETVQGDERDTIIFSIGYGYDRDKKFIQNFGPLNREGGERRLNVAITRAKINVKVVSSISGDDINDSKALGVTLLKKYLKFASTPSVSLLDSNNTSTCFSMEVRDYLLSLGYDLDYKVGYSNLKIDIAIKDKNSNNYIIAIECDGDTYNLCGLCRDRNRLRESILNNLGFKYIRVYSTGWYKDNALEKKILLEKIKKVSNSLDKMSNDEFVISNDSYNDTFEEYVMSPDQKIIDLYKNGNINFEDLVKRVLDNESPLSEKWFVERYKDIFEGTTSPFDEYELRKAMYLDSNIVASKNGYLMYKNDEIKMRIPAIGLSPRDIKYISEVEIAYGMKELLIKNNGLTKEDLFKKLQEVLGYKRMNKSIEAKYEGALKELETITIVSEKNGKITALNI